MWFIGVNTTTKLMGQIAYTCPSCQNNAWHSVGRTRRFFSVLWIPLVPFSKSSVSRCNICGFMQRVPYPQAEAWFRNQTPDLPAFAPPAQQAAALPPQSLAYPTYPTIQTSSRPENARRGRKRRQAG